VPVLLLGGLALGGCGYRFATGEARLADGGRRLAIPLAEHRTTEAWPAAHFTRMLRREAARAGLQLIPADRAGDGCPALWSRVLAAEAVPRAVAVRGGRYRTREQEVRVVVEMALRGRAAAAQPWRLDERVSYLSAPDLRGTEANRQQAVRRALARLARRAGDRQVGRF
jgi:hypothetical protein